LASDAQVGSALIASGDKAEVVASFVEPTRVDAIADTVAEPQKLTITQFFG
jgi:hypothetical protein